jgi:RNA polymerase subunit RPABC4/transcription elongation factor Spt4
MERFTIAKSTSDACKEANEIEMYNHPVKEKSRESEKWTQIMIMIHRKKSDENEMSG